MDTKAHWEHIYQTQLPTRVGWYQAHPAISLEFIRRANIQPTDHIIDVGGGASTLVDDLLAAGFRSVTVLDVSAQALHFARQRLGPQADRVTWIEADITQATLPQHAYAIWHDRAVFHFLTQPGDRQRYIETMRQAVRVGGHVIIATFALDGPHQCSGLAVAQYSSASLHAELGQGFELVDSASEAHHTPWGAEQKFMVGYFRRK
jgi:ubiquinone/menaquinone biosynthesis C-methylase UbiE